MTHCLHCGETVSIEQPEDEASTPRCPRCGGALEDDVVGHGVNRRDLLTYSGGSAMLTLAGFGAGWFVFLRETHGPEEEVVREYVDAIDRGRFNTADSLFHEDAPVDALGPEEFPGIQWNDLSVERTEVVDRETGPGIDGVEELALVHVDIAYENGARSELLELAFVVAKNEDGEWTLWRDR